MKPKLASTTSRTILTFNIVRERLWFEWLILRVPMRIAQQARLWITMQKVVLRCGGSTDTTVCVGLRICLKWVFFNFSLTCPSVYNLSCLSTLQVGNYDSDHNFWLSSESDNGSWETDSARSDPGSPGSLTGDEARMTLSSSLERAMVAMTNLEEIFNDNPNLETLMVSVWLNLGNTIRPVFLKCNVTVLFLFGFALKNMNIETIY